MSKKNKKPINKLSIEKDIADLGKLIQSQNFESNEEMQAFMNQFIGKKVDDILPKNKKKRKKTKKEFAQDLVIQAHDAHPLKAKKLLEKAIKLDPNNADAYIQLAKFERNLHKILKLYKKAVKAGKNAIGEKEFEELKGSFWGFHETRPYMRAKANLASCLTAMERYDQAIFHFKDMMELNPSDNQGIRYHLAVWLVHQNNREEYLKLYEEFKEDSTALWLYTYALFLFKNNGKTSETNAALRKAYLANHFVVEYLTCHKTMPEHLPRYMTLGSESEAVFFMNDSAAIWVATEGAVAWLVDFYRKEKGIN